MNLLILTSWKISLQEWRLVAALPVVLDALSSQSS
jgi:hypothetical protein